MLRLNKSSQLLEFVVCLNKMRHNESDECEPKKTIMQLLESSEVTTICAPMVRYSKLQFRTLVRKYGCDIAYTPMIVSESFLQSETCRNNEFTTNKSDTPLVVQFAASNPKDFADAAELVAPHADGVGLNSGCPQRWAMADGYGAKLLKNPEQLKDYVRFTRAKLSAENFAVSVKIRLHKDIKTTVDMCQMLEHVGVSYIDVHGRTTEERHQPVHYDHIKTIRENVSIPVVANGDVTTLDEVHEVSQYTGCHGVMVARGLLANPAMFDGHQYTPAECIKDWVEICMNLGTPFTCFHNHLIYMMEKVTTKSEKRFFNSLQSTPAVLEYVQQNILCDENVKDDLKS